MTERWARVRTMVFGLAGMWIMNAFLAEFEFLDIPVWHISQSRPTALYPTLLALAMAATLIPVARMIGGKWTVTKMAVSFYVLRSLQILFYLPALGRSQPAFPALALIAGAVCADLVINGGLSRGRYRYALAGAAAAAGIFVSYLPLSGLLPVKAVAAGQLLLFAPLAVAVAAATGYLAGWLGDFALQQPGSGAGAHSVA